MIITGSIIILSFLAATNSSGSESIVLADLNDGSRTIQNYMSFQVYKI